MNHVRYLTNTMMFAPLNYEHTLWLPQAHREQLVDVAVSLRGHASQTDHGGLVGFGVHDVRVYLDGVELTTFVIQELRRLMDAMDQQLLRSSLSAALQDWLHLVRELGRAYGASVEEEQREVDRMLATEPLSANLNQLGDYRVGWTGNLHPFNFLYTHIPLPSVSFFQVIREYNRNQRDESLRLDLKTIRAMTLSHGPCRLFDRASWSPTDPAPRGSVTCIVETHYHNTLEDRLKELEERLERLQETILGELKKMSRALSPAGPIRKQLAELERATDAVKLQMDASLQELASHVRQIQSLQANTDQLRRAIEHL
ncbi:MAG: hypothetical protein KDE27_30625 [Planctomycetes bacterium]|nr:hypothetical protein [Planctomycetota bacterium]